MSIDAKPRTAHTHQDRRATDGTPRLLNSGALNLETGGRLPQVQLAFQTWGRLNPEGSNAVLVLHALTGDAHVADGPGDADGWWRGLVGPGRIVDTERFFVVAPAALGGCSGTTGPASAAPDGAAWGSRFPFITLRDMVSLETRLLSHLGVPAWHTVMGGSMGGARALEWAASRPQQVRRCAVIASCAASTAEQIAWAQAQTAAIRLDPAFRGGDYYRHHAAPREGLGIARRLAHLSYRSEPELETRFGRQPQGSEAPLGSSERERRGRYAVESYLDHQAQKLVDRFDANAYLSLTEALMSHDVGRGRGGVSAALAGADGVEFLVAAVDSDRLYLPGQSEALAAALPGRPDVAYINSPMGHDGFLTQAEQLADPLTALLSD